MLFPSLLVAFSGVAFAVRPFVNEPDTGIDDAIGALTQPGTLPAINSLVGLPDFEWAARRYLNASSYTYYRNGAAGEWSYRNNLEVYNRFRFRPRVMVDVTNLPSSLPTTILGHNFSAPFYISPCARGGLAHPDAERNFVRGAAAENILYIPSLYASLSIEDIAAAKPSNGSQTMFQQVYLNANDTATRSVFKRAEAAGHKALVFTVDAVAEANRQRAARYGVTSANTALSKNSWEYYAYLRNLTSLPIILKGIMSVEDARLAVQHKVPAIILSNHGGRQLDGAPSPLEIALEIYQQAPEIFKQIEVYADGGIRYGTDVLKLLALGVRAVGVGRPFMFSNAYGVDGVRKVSQLLKREIETEAALLGVPDLKQIGPQYIQWTNNNWYS